MTVTAGAGTEPDDGGTAMAEGAMTVAEREAFLADVRVGVLSIEQPGRGPLALPVWYRYEDGVVRISMSGTSVKAQLLRAAGRATLTVQAEELPYRYVSIEGPVVLGPPDGDDAAFATRYLGEEIGAWYLEANPVTEDTVHAQLTPERWLTKDFGKLLGG